MLGTKYLILMCLAVVRISAHPNGAPKEACESMTPQHGDAKPQTTESPYKVKVHENDFKKALLSENVKTLQEFHLSFNAYKSKLFCWSISIIEK